jgi:predicted transposase/invertase (TIGR01784 family)
MTMRRDSIYYKLFKQLPGLLFELIGEVPPDADPCGICEAARYRFDSVEVKESAFRIDGVFLPPEDGTEKIVFFAEVQFQKDEELYQRFFSEIFLFLRRSEISFDDWAGVLIYGSRSMEPSSSVWYRSLLLSSQVSRVYLDELGDWRSQPIELGLVLLTIASEAEAPERARFLIDQGEELGQGEAVTDLVRTIMVYKFSTLGWEAIEAMLNIQDVQLEQTRVYQQVEEKIRGNELREFILDCLITQFGFVPEPARAKIATLSLEQLRLLGKAIVGFQGTKDLENWLVENL